MKARDLPRVKPYVPPPPPTCVACKHWQPEVQVPEGSGSVGMCWLCAHHVVDHGATFAGAPHAQCECLPTEIYPRSFFGPNDEAFERRRDEILERRGQR